ncbi:hypothetical protein [Staphylococcus equorum]|uniref:hypothetical protein n=1 Tax=Staphylococcus equorum TaxID=246432 RepID=UPI003CF1E8D8
MNKNIWIYSKSGMWYQMNTDKELRECVRSLATMNDGFVPCRDIDGNHAYMNTMEIESVTEFGGRTNE